MQIDTGLAVILVAVLIFYLRLIVIQRQRVKQPVPQPQTVGKKKGKKSNQTPPPPPDYSIISRNRRDWIIAGLGIALIILGVLMNRNAVHLPLLQNYWWIPIAAGIVAFSWGFK
jgi:hypothetical protein